MSAKRILTNSLMAVVLSAVTGLALAAGAGQVQYLSGTLSVQQPDGKTKILSQKSQVQPGDVLTTQKDSFAQINFTDGSSTTLRPNTQLKIDSYKYVQNKPEEDSVFFRLLKGGLRTVTGLIGKRGNQDAYKIGTSTATIGIRGSSGDTTVVEAGGNVPPGTYHTTYTGTYVLQNGQGSQLIGEGQFGFAGQGTAPVLLPGDPGLKLENLPFTLGGGGGECAVR
jgi:hypothetical protein